MSPELENRVLELMKQHAASNVFTRGTKIITVTKQKNYDYCWDEEEEVENFVVDDTKRVEALNELLAIGKPAVPTLIKILTSEQGEYPPEYSRIIEGVLPALSAIGDKEISKNLIGPFHQKIRKIAEIRSKQYESAQPYCDQAWSIAFIIKEHPVPEAIPALCAALTQKAPYNKSTLLFSEYLRRTFFDALCKIATKDAAMAILQAVKVDSTCKKQTASNHTQATRSLEENMSHIGKSLYEIYRTTDDPETRQLASEALAWRKPIYWIRQKIGI